MSFDAYPALYVCCPFGSSTSNTGTNVPPQETPEISATKPELEKLAKPQYGGQRAGSGRKPKQEPGPGERLEGSIHAEIAKCRERQEEKQVSRVRSGLADGRDYMREVETVRLS